MIATTLPAISNQATWKDTVELRDAETDALIDLKTEVDEITLKLRDPHSGCTVLTLTLTGDDIVVIDDGVFEFTASAATMSGIDPKSYELGCLVTMADEIHQIILGRQPILKGL
jgi:hypothetical protein